MNPLETSTQKPAWKLWTFSTACTRTARRSSWSHTSQILRLMQNGSSASKTDSFFPTGATAPVPAWLSEYKKDNHETQKNISHSLGRFNAQQSPLVSNDAGRHHRCGFCHRH